MTRRAASRRPTGPITEGQAVYHHLIRPHQAPDGKTPAEAGPLACAQYGFSLGLVLFTLLFLVLYASLGRPVKVVSSTDGE